MKKLEGYFSARDVKRIYGVSDKRLREWLGKPDKTQGWLDRATGTPRRCHYWTIAKVYAEMDRRGIRRQRPRYNPKQQAV